MERSGVFVLDGADHLTPMQPAEFANEDDFQRLLSKFPELLVGDQIDPKDPRRWVLVKREALVSTGQFGASQWSIDHLFLDQDGIPTLVEIKRQSNSEIRRKVIGQMFDYAANFATAWTVDLLRSSFNRTCEEAGRAPDDVLTKLTEQTNIPDFWRRVGVNLETKTLRLLFVADVIPLELRRIVEFLNEQMKSIEVLAVELRQFTSEGLRTIVPTVYGQTQEAMSKNNRDTPNWNEEALFEKMASNCNSAEIDFARRIFNWMTKDRNRDVIFGHGNVNGSVCPAFTPKGVPIRPIYISSDGNIWFQFGSLVGKPVFDSAERRKQLMERFNSINGINFGDEDLTRSRAISLKAILSHPDGEARFFAALSWMETQIEQVY